MKAIQIQRTGGPEVLEYVDVPTPQPGPAQVLVRAHSIGVNMPEVFVRKGVYRWSPPLPVIPGIEMSGTVEAVTLTVLAPNCGQSQCHSTATRTQGYAFDTVHDSVDALQELVYPPQPLQSELWGVIIAQDYSRMPPDVPLATEDIAYIRRWLVAGAPGL